MKPKPYRILALAAASGKVGFVFLTDGEPQDWGLSVKASRSPQNAQDYAAQLIKQYHPDCVVTEQITKHSRKSSNNLALIQSFSKAIDKEVHVEIERVQRYDNKFEEIAALAEQFPQLGAWAVPERKIWLGEHRNTIIFEALSMALKICEPPENLPV